ncbi:sensor histidine kinase [Bryocella elongata]|nr:sensor histidine kinase [Bryocella elongata]
MPKIERKAVAWMWSAYSLFLFIDPILDPRPGLWMKSITVFLTYLAIFTVYISTGSETIKRCMIACTFVLGLVAFSFNGGATCLFIYTAAFIPFSFVDTQIILGMFAAEAGIIIAERYALHLGWPNTIIGLLLMGVVGGSNVFFAQQRRADCKLRMAHEEIEALAALAERERIARDLHDVLGHTLSVITLKAELAGRLLQIDPQRAALEIADVERTARKALSEVREAIGGYRTRGLGAEIEAARATLDAAGVQLIAEAPSLSGLSAAEETVLALALRESVTNIVRHAKATTCKLRFFSESGRRRLLVEDNGNATDLREGNGLRGMRERVESLGGHVKLEHRAGTRLLIELPLQAEGAAS